MVARELKRLIFAPAAKERQREHGGNAEGQNSTTLVQQQLKLNKPPSAKPQSRRPRC